MPMVKGATFGPYNCMPRKDVASLELKMDMTSLGLRMDNDRYTDTPRDRKCRNSENTSQHFDSFTLMFASKVHSP